MQIKSSRQSSCRIGTGNALMAFPAAAAARLTITPRGRQTDRRRKSPIEMSSASPIEMSLGQPVVAALGVTCGDGDSDERPGRAGIKPRPSGMLDLAHVDAQCTAAGVDHGRTGCSQNYAEQCRPIAHGTARLVPFHGTGRLIRPSLHGRARVEHRCDLFLSKPLCAEFLFQRRADSWSTRQGERALP